METLATQANVSLTVTAQEMCLDQQGRDFGAPNLERDLTHIRDIF